MKLINLEERTITKAFEEFQTYNTAKGLSPLTIKGYQEKFIMLRQIYRYG